MKTRKKSETSFMKSLDLIHNKFGKMKIEMVLIVHNSDAYSAIFFLSRRA